MNIFLWARFSYLYLFQIISVKGLWVCLTSFDNQFFLFSFLLLQGDEEDSILYSRIYFFQNLVVHWVALVMQFNTYSCELNLPTSNYLKGDWLWRSFFWSPHTLTKYHKEDNKMLLTTTFLLAKENLVVAWYFNLFWTFLAITYLRHLNLRKAQRCTT